MDHRRSSQDLAKEFEESALVANLAHYWSPADNTTLLRRIRAAAPQGARLLLADFWLADFWTDPTHTQPVQAALMAGEFAVHLIAPGRRADLVVLDAQLRVREVYRAGVPVAPAPLPD